MKKAKKIFITTICYLIVFQIVTLLPLGKTQAQENVSVAPEQTTSSTADIVSTTSTTGALEEGATGTVGMEENLPTEQKSLDPGIPTDPNPNQPEGNLQEPQLPEVRNNQRSLEVDTFQTNQVVSGTAEPVINEIDYDQPGTDTAEFIEIKNLDNATIDLDGYSLQLINGAGGGATIYRTIILPNVSLVANDYYVICGNVSTVANCDLDVSPDTDLIQNGAPDAIALIYLGAIVDTVSYEGNTGMPYTEGSGVGLLDSGISANSISRYPDGSDTDQNNIDFFLRSITPGAPNYAGKPTGGEVNDGLGADIDFSNDPASLSSNWSGFSDPIVGINHYQYAFGTSAGASDIISWTNVGLATNVAVSATLSENQTYYASVKAVNDDGVPSDIVSSDGVTIDTTPPEIKNVIFTTDDDDSILKAGQAVQIELFTEDPEADLLISGLFNGQALVWTMEIEPLTGPFYKATYLVEEDSPNVVDAQLKVTATDRVGNTSAEFVKDSGIAIDTTPPAGPTSVSVIPGTESIIINWSASASDDVIGYNIYRASSPYVKINDELIPATQNQYVDQDVEEGITYYYKITAVDAAGNETPLELAVPSAAAELTSISQVVGQIAEPAVKVAGANINLIPSAQATAPKNEIKGEKAIKTEPQTETPKEEGNNPTNWPMIIAIILAGLIILAGVWYWWVVTRSANYMIAAPKKRRVSRTKKRGRSK